MRIAFKDMYIQPLSEPRADAENTPGFHLRTLGSSGDERKYVVYIPRGYDGATAFPAVLFLHGAGERGKDGVVSAQVGLGPAILNGLQPFPAIAVIPQARQSWSADSDDAKAALAALDEVQKTLKVDPRRVVLTGLSMGGRGTWEVAAANPDRFSAIIPICGRGRPETSGVLAKLPAWIVVGDADSDATVLNCRAMVEALSTSGGKPRYTEYRGVGHNSWDRAYSNPALIQWMLAQSRQ
jgi:predicted peptidase